MTGEVKVAAAVAGLLAVTLGQTPTSASERCPGRCAGEARPDTAEIRLSGTVLDAEGRPVRSAEVMFVPRGGSSGSSARPVVADGPSAVTARTDSSGQFSFRVSASDGGRVGLVSAGGERWEFGVDFVADSDLYLDVVLPPARRGGAWPVTVDVESRPAALRGSGFFRRRSERDGFFVGPEELRGAARDGQLARMLSTARGMVRTSACPEPAEYVDGERLSDRLTGPNRLELLALEAYRRSDPPPPGFARPADCGVLLLWTGPATPGRADGEGRR